MLPSPHPIRRPALVFTLGVLLAGHVVGLRAAPPPAGPLWETRIADDGSAEIRWKKSGAPLFRTLGIRLLDARGTLCADPDAAPPRRFGDLVCRATDTSRIRMRLAELPGGAVRCAWSMHFLKAIPCAELIVLDCELYATRCETLPAARDGAFRRRLVTPDGDATLSVSPGTIPESTPAGKGKVRMRMRWRYDPFFGNTIAVAVTLAPESGEKPPAQESGEDRRVLRK